MLEIVFNDSACGSLKAAQHYGEGKFRGGCIGVIVGHTDGRKPTKREIKNARREAEEKERLKWESAVPMGGNPADIYGFGLMLSVGDISENQPGSQRRQVLERLYGIYPYEDGRQAAQKLIQKANDDLKMVCDRAEAGEALRIWYSNQPDELCGMHWFMNRLIQLEERCGQIYLVKLPEWESGEKDTIIQKNDWNEVAPAEWHRYLALQRPASLVFCRSCASHWRTLQKENAPLRAMLNGRLVSVPESLYDDFITREIAAEGEEFQEAVIIGRVLGRYQLGIGDSWAALRIEEMIRTGKLEAVSEAADDMPAYRRVLKKPINI